MSRYKIAICEIHNPLIHGTDYTSDPNISNHYLVETIIDNKDFFNQEDFLDIQSHLNFLKLSYERIQCNHPIIRNYREIIHNKYMKYEIIEEDYLDGGECVGYIKTFWLKILQRKWKKIFAERKRLINKRKTQQALHYREIYGQWPKDCMTFPHLRLT